MVLRKHARFASRYCEHRLKEEPPYKPETTLLCVTARLRNVIALNTAPKVLIKVWRLFTFQKMRYEYSMKRSIFNHSNRSRRWGFSI
jgi:hypothetical protein